MLAIGRALMARPRMLPSTSPRRPRSRGRGPAGVRDPRAPRARLSILLVEQNVGVAAALARRAHVLRNGEIAVSGPAADLLRNPDVLASYLGR